MLAAMYINIKYLGYDVEIGERNRSGDSSSVFADVINDQSDK